MKNKILKPFIQEGSMSQIVDKDDCLKAMNIYLKETIDLLDNKITDIRIQLAKTSDREILDKMLYDLQIDIFKLEK
jgi:hypothetical protein